MTEILRLEKVSYTYPDGTRALSEVSLTLLEGETLALLGPGGSGKSTLLLILAGLLKPTSGRVLYRMQDLQKVYDDFRKSIGILFQDPDDMLISTTVYDEIALSLRYRLNDPKAIHKRVIEVALTLGIEGLLHRPPYRLSGSEKRKVALASVIAFDPNILLLDEPTAELSSKDVEVLTSLLMSFKKKGKTIVIASQDVEFAAEVSDRVCLMVSGKIVAVGEARRVLSDCRLLSSAGVKPPIAVRVYHSLFNPAREGSSDTAPLTFKEIAEILREHCLKERG